MATGSLYSPTVPAGQQRAAGKVATEYVCLCSRMHMRLVYGADVRACHTAVQQLCVQLPSS